MINKFFIISSLDGCKILDFGKELILNHLKFNIELFVKSKNDKLYLALFTFKISKDMVKEVEEFIQEIAEKSGVKVE